MTNGIAALIFGARSVKKAEINHDPSRLWIGGGQIDKALNEAIKFDGAIGKTAQTAVDALDIAAKNDKLFEHVGKVVKFAGEYVNPIICVTSGVKVLNADDKKSALIQEGSALGTMFTVEGLMKKYLDEVPKIKGVDKWAEKVTEYASKSKAKGMIPSIIKGTAFVIGSCTAYNVGSKFGTLINNHRNQNQTETA